jgi:hypothetical protein
LGTGKRAYVTGTVRTNINGERYIDASTAWCAGAGPVRPVFLTGGAIGGSDSIDSLTRYGQQGVAGGIGINNIGGLIRTSGSYHYVDAQTFTVYDGSRATKCVAPVGVVPDLNWRSVTVTGISSCEKVGTQIVSVVRVRAQSDIVPVD